MAQVVRKLEDVENKKTGIQAIKDSVQKKADEVKQKTAQKSATVSAKSQTTNNRQSSAPTVQQVNSQANNYYQAYKEAVQAKGWADADAYHLQAKGAAATARDAQMLQLSTQNFEKKVSALGKQEKLLSTAINAYTAKQMEAPSSALLPSSGDYSPYFSAFRQAKASSPAFGGKVEAPSQRETLDYYDREIAKIDNRIGELEKTPAPWLEPDLNKQEAANQRYQNAFDTIQQLRAQRADLSAEAAEVERYGTVSDMEGLAKRDKLFSMYAQDGEAKTKQRHFSQATQNASAVIMSRNSGMTNLIPSTTSEEWYDEYQAMSNDQKRVYDYYIGRGDAESAEAYRKALRRDLNKKMADAQIERAKGEGARNPFGTGAASVLLQPVAATATIADMLTESVSGLQSNSKYAPYADPNTPGQTQLRMVQAYRQAGLEKIENPFLKSALNAAYSAIDQIPSLVMTVAIPGLGEELGLAYMSILSGADKYTEMTERGVTQWQATTSAIASATASYLMEKGPMDDLAAAFLGGKKTAKSMIRQVGAAILGENMEELGENGLELLYDGIINGTKSSRELSIRSYMQQGMSREEAEKKAWEDFGAEQWETILTTTLSTAMLIGPGTVRSAVATHNYNQARNTKEGRASIAISAGQQYMAAVQEHGENSQEAREAFQVFQNAVAQAENANAVSEKLSRVEPVARQMQTEEPAVQYALRDHAAPTYEELISKPDIPVVDIRREHTGDMATERAAAKKSRSVQELYQTPVINKDTGEPLFITPKTITHTFSNLGLSQVDLVYHLREISENAVLTYAEATRNTPSDQSTGTYTFFAAAKTEEGTVPVKLKVKEYVSANSTMPRTVRESAEGQRPETFATEYDGRVLVVEGIEKEPSSSALPDRGNNLPEQHPSGSSTISIRELYGLVNKEYQKYLPSRQYSIGKEAQGSLPATEAGRLLEGLAKATGTKISTEGTFRPGEAGYYDRGTGTLYINPQAETRQQLAAVFTHELTHHLEGTESYGKLRDMLVSRWKAEGQFYDKILAKIREYRAHGVSINREGAISEMVAEYAQEHLFTDAGEIRGLAAYDLSLAGRIKNWISRKVAGVTGNTEKQFLRNAEHLYTQAIREAEKGQGVRGNNALRFSVSSAKEKVDRATQMLDNGATYSDVFRETGLVINLGGEIQDGFGGEVIGRYERGRDNEGPVVPMREGDESAGREDRRGLEESLGAARKRGWRELRQSERERITEAVEARVNGVTGEAADFKEMFSSVSEYAEAFYNLLHDGRPNAERWSYFIPDLQGLMDEIDGIVSEERRQYSLKKPETNTEKFLRQQERENARLREKLEETQRQLKRTTVKMPSVSQMRAEVRAVMRGYGVRENNGNVLIYREIKQLYELMGNGKTTINGRVWELTSENANRLALEIADQVLSRSRVKEDMAEYQDLRETLKGASIHVPQEIRNDLSMPFQDFKRQYGKEIKFSKDGVGIEMVWQELEEQYPGLFDGSEYLNPADMLNHLGEVLDATRPVESNPFEEGTQAWEIERQHLANDILDRFYEIPQQKPTFADKQYRKLMWAKVNAQNKLAEVKAHYEQRVAAERERGNAKAERVKEHYRERDAAAKARKTENQERTQLLKVARRLERLKTTATNRATINEMIGDLDTVAKSITGNTVQRLNALNDWYQDRKTNDPDFINDPGVEKSLQRLSKRQISDLSLDEVRELTDALLNIENEIRTEKKLLDTKERRDIYALGEQAIKDINESAGSKGGPVDRFLVTQTLSPVRYFRRMVGYVENSPMMKLVNGLADGQRKMLDYQMRAEKPFETFANDKQFNRDFSGAKAKEIRISGMDGTGKTITLSITPAMRASLYLHSLNSQNLRHIAEGGITVPDMKLYKAGKIAEAYARGQTIRLDPFQVKAIASGMSKQERAFTELVHDYFNGQSRDEINATSEILKGYSLAGVENYFPINTDSSFTRSEFESLKKDGTIEGMGFLKERINAANPIFLRDVNTVLDQSIQMHGKYVGMAIPVRNFQKVWNVTTNNYTESGERIAFSASVQQAVRRQWGETAIKYVDKLMGDLQNGSAEKNELIKALNKVRSNYAGAVLTLNLSVAMKQAASYPTAAAVLGWRPLLSAMHNLGHVDLDLIAKYTPLQWYRSKGFSTKELGDLSKTDSLMGKLLSHKVLNWVQGVDLLTTRKLWKASEYYVRQNQKELNVGTDAYYRAVADIYNRVIEETQPNYTTMQRPQLLRSDDSLLGSLQMFKTQPFQNTNILYDAAENLRAKLKQGDKAAIREARKGFSRAVTSQLGQLAVFAGMTFLWALMRGKTDKYKDDKDEITFESVLSALGKDMLGGLAAGVPFGSDAWDLANSKIFGERYYGMDSVTVTAISDTVKSLGKMGDLIGKTVEQVANGDAVNWNQFRITTVKQMNVISKAFGIPLENVVNIYEAITGQVMRAAYGENKGDFYNLLLTKDPKEDTKAYFDILYKALAADDDETYNDLKARLLDGGVVTRDQLWNAMTERFKKDWQADDSLQYNSHLMKEAGVTQEMIADWRRTEFRNAYDKDPSIAEDAAAMSRAGVSEDTIAEWEEAKWKSSGYLEDLQAVGADLDAADKVVRSITKQKGDSKKWKTLEESGLPEDQQEIIMKVFAGKDDLNRWDVFKENGMSLQNFYSVRSRYALVKGDEVMNEKEKPLEFVHWLAQQNFSDKEVDVIRGVFIFDQSATTRYEKFLDAGVAEDDAYEIAGDLAGLKPLTGASSVSDKQRESAIAFGSYTQQTKLKALSAIMDEAKTEKLKGAMSAGIGLDAYMDYYLNASGIKSDEGAKSGGAGSAKQKKMTFIDEIPGLNTEHKDYIYLYVEGWSAKTLGDAPWHGGERYSGELPKHGKVDASTSKAVPTTTEKATSTSTSTARTSGSSSTRSSGSRSSGSRSSSTGTRTASTRVSTAGTTSGSLKARGSTGRATARTAASRIVLPSLKTASTMPSLKINLPEKLKRVVYGTSQKKLKKL